MSPSVACSGVVLLDFRWFDAFVRKKSRARRQCVMIWLPDEARLSSSADSIGIEIDNLMICSRLQAGLQDIGKEGEEEWRLAHDVASFFAAMGIVDGGQYGVLVMLVAPVPWFLLYQWQRHSCLFPNPDRERMNRDWFRSNFDTFAETSAKGWDGATGRRLRWEGCDLPPLD